MGILLIVILLSAIAIVPKLSADKKYHVNIISQEKIGDCYKENNDVYYCFDDCDDVHLADHRMYY
jgi:hypothetical protein